MTSVTDKIVSTEASGPFFGSSMLREDKDKQVPSIVVVVQENRSFTDVVHHPFPPLKIKAHAQQLELINGELVVSFLEGELEKMVEDFKFASVLKFFDRCLPIDFVQQKIVKSWGFLEVPMTTFMDNQHILLYFVSKHDHMHACAREGQVIVG